MLTTTNAVHRMRKLWLLPFCVCVTLPAAALEVVFAGQNRVLDPNFYEQLFGSTAPMLAPGDVALIDDYFHNTTLDYSSALPGDSLGIRATSPTGAISTNVVTRGTTTNCWFAGLVQYCPAYSSGGWYLGTSIRLKPVGQWKVEVLKNNVVVTTFFFQLKPYFLDTFSQTTQTISARTTTPQALVVRMTQPDGQAASAGKDVVFTMTSRPGGASPAGGLSSSPSYSGTAGSPLTVQTAADGTARVYVEAGGKAGAYVVSATSAFAPGVTRTFTINATATLDPTDSASKEKNLGLDPAHNSSCANASKSTTGNPINVATGNKVAAELDYGGAGPFPLEATRTYNSIAPRPGSFGNNWRGFYDRSIVVTSTTVKGKTTTVAEAVRMDGKVLKFTLTGGAWVSDPDVVDRLDSVAGGYRFTCGNDQVEQYAANGKLSSVSAREGFAQVLAYDAQGRLSQVTDAFGRMLSFGYDNANRVTSMTDPAGRSYVYAYSATGNLISVQYPDLKARVYHYENTSFPRALTGITDENQVRLTTYTYKADGDAVQSVRAGGALSSTVLHYTDGSRSVLDGAGNYRRYAFAVIQGVARRTSLDNAACSSCGNAATATAYSTTGYVSGITDYRGTQTTFLRNTRGLETSRTEAVGTTEARTITTTWHATFRLPLVMSRPGRSTTFTYDSAGRVLTRTETDTATTATRRWTYSYNSQGLLASVNGPRIDIADVTSYTYGAQGNLATVTNARGHVTSYTSYDAHGRPLSMTDPNGLITTFTYDLRGRLLTRNSGGLLTVFSYTPAGQPLRTTNPDGSWTERQYDAAQQEVGLIDSAGQRIAYTLDGNGRRTREEHFDAFNVSVYQRGWSHDALGRVLIELDAQGAVQWRHAYDANGNRVSSTDPYGAASIRAYDALDRIRTSTDALGAATAYAHDARDNLIRVTDPRSVITQYAYDGLDNLVQESSPDAGTSAFSYDAAGNLKTRSWANARSVAYTLDALNRVTLEDYGSGVQVGHSYDSGANGLGRQSGSTDASGSKTWAYDAWGRVVQSVRTTGSRVLATGYGYDAAGRMASMTYPSGRSIGYGYDSAGRVTSMTVDGQSLLGNIAWQPFGAMKSWSQGNGRAVARSFDRDGRLKTQSFDIGSRTLDYDAKGRLTNIAEPWGNRSYGYDNADRLATEAAWAGNWSYAWDGNGNRQSQTSPQGATSYTYETGNNRLQSAAGVDVRGFTHDTAGNMTSEGGYGFGYDARNRLALATSPTTSTSYAHDGLGRRVFKSNTAVRHFAHDEQRKVIGEYDASSTLSETVWLGSTPISVLRNGATYWIDADQIDTPRAVLDAGNQIVWRWRAEAFGNAQAEEDPSGLGAFEFNHRFPGQMFDKESALHHNDHRDYRAHTGRFAESDPIGLHGGVNRYTYGDGSPTHKTDALGLATYMCTQPLHALGAVGRALYAPDKNPLFHQFIGILRPDGTVYTGGQDRAAGPWGAGKPSAGDGAAGSGAECAKVEDDNECLERCLLGKFAGPRPEYALFLPKATNQGQHCQVWANDILSQCRTQCAPKK